MTRNWNSIIKCFAFRVFVLNSLLALKNKAGFSNICLKLDKLPTFFTKNLVKPLSMGDPEANSLQKTPTNMKAISLRSYGCSFTYLFSIPGLFRVINIVSFSKKNSKILEKSDFFKSGSRSCSIWSLATRI